jgi:phenol 2-monooxygenase
LQTYAPERRKVAEQLIDADRQLSRLVATQPSAKQLSADQRKTDTADIEAFMARQNGFIAGTAIGYYPSYICRSHENQELATGLNIGQRFHSAIAVRVADGRQQHLGHLVKADGRWRIFIFGSTQNPRDAASDSRQLIEFLVNDPASPVVRYTAQDADIDSVIDVYGIFQQHDLAIEDIPDFLWPPGGKYGLRDYEKVFYGEKNNDVFDMRGIDRSRGCMVVVRPDQHIATILPLTAHAELAAFFDEFLLVPDET